MSLLSKLFNRKNQEFVKGDVKIYIQCIDDATELKKDSYVVAGIYNTDGTLFKNILTGETVQTSKDDESSMVINNKYYGKLADIAFRECTSGVRGLVDVYVMRYEMDCEVKQNFIEGRMLEPFYVNPNYERGMKHILDYLLKGKDEKVSLDEIKNVSKVLNKIVYKNHKIMYNNLEGSLHNQVLRSSYKNF